MRRLALGLVAVLAAGFSARAARATEREHQLGADLGLSILSIQDKSSLDIGGGIGVHYSYGLTDQFNFLAEANGSIVSLGETSGKDIPHTRPSTLTTAGVGLGYVLDITQWVPYFGALIGAGMMTGGTLDSALFLPDAQIAAGVDYRLNRDFAFGVAGRQHLFFTQLSEYPSFTTVTARFEYTWGW